LIFKEPAMPRKPQAKRKRGQPAYRFTKEDCQRGYQAALKKCMESWELYAWLYYRIRGFYRRKE
jgi:hypothetical protein